MKMQISKEYFVQAAKVVRSSQRMVQRNVEICRDTPEMSGKYYDPDWNVSISQSDAQTLIENLAKVAELFDALSERGAA